MKVKNLFTPLSNDYNIFEDFKSIEFTYLSSRILSNLK